MSRRFGVEIEFLSTITKEQAVMSLRAAGIRVESSYYTHDTTPYWKIVTDGSCGYELVSPGPRRRGRYRGSPNRRRRTRSRRCPRWTSAADFMSISMPAR